ncbi:hypothetical protein DY000_02058495 [Brassica cretica]|uniref:JmjN domain-containing protein n=1 Tax=Brassica cretica TaxID=69181 RepID=A0ABQ7AZ13_BRACR|nr:hypothetical protein DY000_02058495 [Brassica cretica]
MEDFLELEEFLELEDGENLKDWDIDKEITMEYFLELEKFLKRHGDFTTIDHHPPESIDRHPPDCIDRHPLDDIDQHPRLDELPGYIVELKPIEESMYKFEDTHLAVPTHMRPPICAEEAAWFHKRLKRLHDPVKFVVPCAIFEAE